MGQSRLCRALALAIIAPLALSTPSPATPPDQVIIDQAWLDAAGPPPYLLTQASYRLAADITSDGPGVVLAAANQTLDLAGHKITYNNAPPLVVPGGEFEDPSSLGWDTSGAPDSTFAIQPNTVWLFGSFYLQWTVAGGITTPQVIRSSPIPISAVNQVYSATATMANKGTSSRTATLKIEVEDAATGQTMADFSQFNTSPSHGGSPMYNFIARAPGSVRIRLTLVPAAGSAPCVVPVDRVRLTRSFCYGVLASSTFHTGLALNHSYNSSGGKVPDAIDNYPAGFSVYNKVDGPSITDSVGGGSIVQGQGRGALSHGIVMVDTKHAVAVSNVSVSLTGDSCNAIKASGGTSAAGNSRSITGCTISYADGVNILNRDYTIAALDVNGHSNLTVSGNTILGAPQTSIWDNNADDGTLHVISGNTIKPNTVITNGYAIQVGPHSRILNNTIDTEPDGSSRGIFLETLSASDINDVVISGNTVWVREKANREYGTDTPARAFKIRVYGDGVFNDVNVSNNLFTAIAEAGCLDDAAGGSAYFALGKDASGNPKGSQRVRFADNLFKGIVRGATDPGTGYQAYGFSFDIARGPGNDIRFDRCTFESNGVGVQFGTPTSLAADQERDLTFAACTWRKSAEGCPRSNYAMGIGYYQHTISNVTVLDDAYEGGASRNYLWAGTGAKCITYLRTVTQTLTDQVISGTNKPIADPGPVQ